jgi:hypothetical protein
MVRIKIFLNNYYIKNVSDPFEVNIIDTFPKLKANIVYTINLYYKDRGYYHNTNSINLKLIYNNKEYYLFEHIKGYYYKVRAYNKIISEPTMKMTINESDQKLYKIQISSFKEYYIFTEKILNIKIIIRNILTKYEYTINNIDASCIVSKEGCY